MGTEDPNGQHSNLIDNQGPQRTPLESFQELAGEISSRVNIPALIRSNNLSLLQEVAFVRKMEIDAMRGLSAHWSPQELDGRTQMLREYETGLQKAGMLSNHPNTHLKNKKWEQEQSLRRELLPRMQDVLNQLNALDRNSIYFGYRLSQHYDIIYLNTFVGLFESLDVDYPGSQPPSQDFDFKIIEAVAHYTDDLAEAYGLSIHTPSPLKRSKISTELEGTLRQPTITNDYPPSNMYHLITHEDVQSLLTILFPPAMTAGIGTINQGSFQKSMPQDLFPDAKATGQYFGVGGYNRNGARIEIYTKVFIDNPDAISQEKKDERRWEFKFVLAHEIGHHIHLTLTKREIEDWEAILSFPSLYEPISDYERDSMRDRYGAGRAESWAETWTRFALPELRESLYFNHRSRYNYMKKIWIARSGSSREQANVRKQLEAAEKTYESNFEKGSIAPE